MSRPYRHDEVAHRSGDLYRSHSHRNYDYDHLSLDSAFGNLDLNVRDRRHPRSSSVYASPNRPVQGISSPGHASVSALRHHMGTPAQGPLDLIPANRRSPLIPRDLYRHGRPTPLTNDPPSLSHGIPSPGYGRYSVDGWRTSGASPISRVSQHFSRHLYHDGDRFINTRRFASSTDGAVLCNCRTCVEHRYPIQDWALIGHDHFSGRESPAYRGEVYHPMARSSRSPRPRRYLSPTRDDWVYDDEDYYLPNYDGDAPDDDHYAYPPDGLAWNDVHRTSSPMHLGLPHYVDYRNSYDSDDDSDRGHNDVGSDHEYSDNASYTGHERYGYSDDEYADVF